MKVLWVTNIMFEHHLTMMGLDTSNVFGGSWLVAAYESSLGDRDIQLHIVTVSNVNKRIIGERDGNYFYILPGGSSRNYDIDSPANISEWERLKNEIQPDVVLIWGTETRFAYLATKVMKSIPMAVYIQGVMSAISAHFYEGVPHYYQCRTLRDYLDRLDHKSKYSHFKRQAVLENEMLHFASAVIVENNWCEDMCKVVNPSLMVYRNDLPIRDSFYQSCWGEDTIVPQTIFTNAGGYPIKGHHILFKALGVVKKRFPNFKCYIPGEKLDVFKNIKRRTGFTTYLEKLIEENHLLENVIYTGKIPSKDVVDHIAHCNVFVMPSMVENHSSSLIEAMIVGAPCISSLVGGTAGIIEHNKNGILYNSLDANSLAGSIMRVFDDIEIAKKLSSNAKKLRETRSRHFGEELRRIYFELSTSR